MHAGAQVKGLQAAHIVLDVRVQPRAHLVERALVVRDAGAQHQILDVLERLGDLLTAGHLAHAEVARAVLEHHDVAREERRMRAGQVQLHAVVSRNGVHIHFDDFRDHCQRTSCSITGIFACVQNRAVRKCTVRCRFAP